MTHSTFSDNSVPGIAGLGGAILNSFGTTTVTDSTFADNDTSGGSAIFTRTPRNLLERQAGKDDAAKLVRVEQRGH